MRRLKICYRRANSKNLTTKKIRKPVLKPKAKKLRLKQNRPQAYEMNTDHISVEVTPLSKKKVSKLHN
jgi:hypothetical protein